MSPKTHQTLTVVCIVMGFIAFCTMMLTPFTMLSTDTCTTKAAYNRSVGVIEFNEGSRCYMYGKHFDCIWETEALMKDLTSPLYSGSIKPFDGQQVTNRMAGKRKN